MNCDADLLTILSIVKWVFTWICRIIPIILIILLAVDLAKVVTAGNLDDKMKKEVGNKAVTRVAYALIIFLLPTLVSMFFNILPQRVVDSTSAGDSNWYECWKEA